MAIRESHLPGIGRKYELDGQNRSRVVAVVHNTGRRDLYVYRRGDPKARCQVELDDGDARRLGAILAGSYFHPAVAEGIEDLMGRLVIDWVPVDESSRVVGKTIRELQIRTATGVTVIAIGRGTTSITNPGPETRLLEGDRVIVVGPTNRVDEFSDFVAADGG